jgi:hypothetical protein
MTLVQRARELSAGANVKFVKEDFFAYQPPQLFDFVFDYTCVSGL